VINSPISFPAQGNNMATGKKSNCRTAVVGQSVGADLRTLAQTHGAEAISRLVDLMTHAESETARIAAARELLDRGYGKVTQAVEMSGPGGAAVLHAMVSPKQLEAAVRNVRDKY